MSSEIDREERMKNRIAMMSDIRDLIKPLYTLKAKVEQLEIRIEVLERRVTLLSEKEQNKK
jgi:hypothetical protein